MGSIFNPQIGFSAVSRVTGWLLLILGSSMALPLLACVIYGEPEWIVFLTAGAVSAAVGLAMTLPFRGRKLMVKRREAYLATATAWIAISAFGMLPFMFCRAPLSVSDAFFETMSGLTTTGATVFADVEVLSHGVLLWRGMLQWFGGLGIVLLTLALLPELNQNGGILMFNTEVTGITHDKIHPRIATTARSLWTVYSVLTVMCILMLWAGPMSLFDSICHGLTTLSTGGFSTRNAGPTGWDSGYVDTVITVFMFFGGVNFILIYKCCHGGWRELAGNDVFRCYVGVILVSATAICITLAAAGTTGWRSLVVAPLMQTASAITSTGYSAFDYESAGPFVAVVIVALMVSGACAGSTTGGVKIDRMLSLWRHMVNESKHTIFPNRLMSVSVGGRILGSENISRVSAFLWIYVLLAVSATSFGCMLGVNAPDSLFATLSAIGNNGLGYGLTGAQGGFRLLPDAMKWVLALVMMAGRLELYSIIALFLPAFWRK